MLYMRSKAWLAAPVLLAHAEVTEIIIFSSMGPKLRYPMVKSAALQHVPVVHASASEAGGYGRDIVHTPSCVCAGNTVGRASCKPHKEHIKRMIQSCADKKSPKDVQNICRNHTGDMHASAMPEYAEVPMPASRSSVRLKMGKCGEFRNGSKNDQKLWGCTGKRHETGEAENARRVSHNCACRSSLIK